MLADRISERIGAAIARDEARADRLEAMVARVRARLEADGVSRTAAGFAFLPITGEVQAARERARINRGTLAARSMQAVRPLADIMPVEAPEPDRDAMAASAERLVAAVMADVALGRRWPKPVPVPAARVAPPRPVAAQRPVAPPRPVPLPDAVDPVVAAEMGRRRLAAWMAAAGVTSERLAAAALGSPWARGTVNAVMLGTRTASAEGGRVLGRAIAALDAAGAARFRVAMADTGPIRRNPSGGASRKGQPRG